MDEQRVAILTNKLLIHYISVNGVYSLDTEQDLVKICFGGNLTEALYYALTVSYTVGVSDSTPELKEVRAELSDLFKEQWRKIFAPH